MQADFKQMVKEMLGFEESEEIPEEALFRLTNVFAYSPFVQYLYSRHLKEKNDHRYAASVAKTALYFSNPHWLHHQLRNGKSDSTEEKEKRLFQIYPTVSEEMLTDQQTDTNQPETEEIVDTESASVVSEETEVNQEVESNENLDKSFNEPDVEQSDPENHEALISHTQNEIVPTEITEEELMLEEPDGFNEHQGFDLFLDELNQEMEDPPESENAVENIDEPAENKNTELMIKSEEIAVYPEFETPPDPDASAEEDINFAEAGQDGDYSDAGVEVQSPGSEEIIPEVNSANVQEENVELTRFSTMTSDIPERISFEPLYTIDYFASQGIKLNQEEESKDQLSSRLKSFTDWLKSMKKLHPEKLSREMDEKTEITIKNEAEHSNDQSEVLTETMAEIFIDQGLTEKALEIYEKLSLLNPSKSDYFAAKISATKSKGV